MLPPENQCQPLLTPLETLTYTYYIFLLIFIPKMGIIYINLCGNLQVYTIFFNKLKIFSVSGQAFSRYLSNNNFSIENGN